SNGYWELRYIRHNHAGAWVDSQDVLIGRREWDEPRDGADVLADWPHIAVDASGSIHLGWHGSARTRIYGNDQAYYIRREAVGPHRWHAAWQSPRPIYPIGSAQGVKFSFAPVIAFDGDRALPITFYDVYGDRDWAGFDTVARLARDGVIEG